MKAENEGLAFDLYVEEPEKGKAWWVHVGGKYNVSGVSSAIGDMTTVLLVPQDRKGFLHNCKLSFSQPFLPPARLEQGVVTR